VTGAELGVAAGTLFLGWQTRRMANESKTSTGETERLAVETARMASEIERLATVTTQQVVETRIDRQLAHHARLWSLRENLEQSCGPNFYGSTSVAASIRNIGVGTATSIVLAVNRSEIPNAEFQGRRDAIAMFRTPYLLPREEDRIGLDPQSRALTSSDVAAVFGQTDFGPRPTILFFWEDTLGIRHRSGVTGEPHEMCELGLTQPEPYWARSSIVWRPGA